MKLDPTQTDQPVGARRWPFSACHPWVWLQPHKGVLLSARDTRAWAGDRFGEVPDQKAVDEHVDWCERHGLLQDRVPVMWDFTATGGSYCIYWERVSQLRAYVEDYAEWVIARAEAQARPKAAESSGGHDMRKCCGNCSQRRDVPVTDRMFGTGFINCALKPSSHYVSPTRGICERHQVEHTRPEARELAELF